MRAVRTLRSLSSHKRSTSFASLVAPHRTVSAYSPLRRRTHSNASPSTSESMSLQRERAPPRINDRPNRSHANASRQVPCENLASSRGQIGTNSRCTDRASHIIISISISSPPTEPQPHRHVRVVTKHIRETRPTDRSHDGDINMCFNLGAIYNHITCVVRRGKMHEQRNSLREGFPRKPVTIKWQCLPQSLNRTPCSSPNSTQSATCSYLLPRIRLSHLAVPSLSLHRSSFACAGSPAS
jgi:hypothetical protein